MSRIDILRQNYQRLCEYSWDRNVAGAQRVWIAVYDKEDERKLRLRIDLFKEATQLVRRRWVSIDLTDAFARWMCGPDHASFSASYFESPDLLDEAVLADFKTSVASTVRATLAQLPDPENTVVALVGAASLFGFMKVSELLPMVEADVRGRLLVFFPGTYEPNNYRLLDAGDGWNYHAVPITASEAEARP